MSSSGSSVVSSQSAEASFSAQALMGELAAQSKRNIAANLAMGRMGQEAGVAEGVAKKLKAQGESVKGLA